MMIWQKILLTYNLNPKYKLAVNYSVNMFMTYHRNNEKSKKKEFICKFKKVSVIKIKNKNILKN